MAKRWTEAMVYSLLAKRFPSPAYVLLPQVRNGTGFSRKRDRTADAIAVSTWPSRGLSISGIEIKVARSDWLKELADPQKSTDFMKYCHHWYVAAPTGVVDAGEVPETWGYIECQSTASIRTAVPAKNLEPLGVDMLLLCSILRKASEVMTPTENVRQRIDDGVDAALDRHTSVLKHRINELEETIATFEEASGVSLGKRWDAGNIGEAVKFVRETGVDGAKASVRRMRDEARRVADRLTKSLAELGIDDN